MLSSAEVEERRPWWHERCPECGGDEFVTDLEAGEVACRRCGLVLQEAMLDQRPEWTAFTLEEREEKSRGG
jgi:transcription initiation factor TFIIB